MNKDKKDLDGDLDLLGMIKKAMTPDPKSKTSKTQKINYTLEEREAWKKKRKKSKSARKISSKSKKINRRKK